LTKVLADSNTGLLATEDEVGMMLGHYQLFLPVKDTYSALNALSGQVNMKQKK
jgi:hypothetical protein